AQGGDAIRALVTRTTARPVPVVPVAPNGNGNGNGAHAVPAATLVGQPAPEVSLPDLDGETVTLQAFRGTPTLLLFWNPGCGFCSRMLDHLKAWEANAPAGAPRLLVVSTGTVEANREMGLTSTVVLDQGFATGNAFGVSGTPSAVLIDAEGRIAFDPAVGAPAVLALANREAVGPRAS
ncbi:MAG: TlpA family protein disulfide reductase, partial [Chloroflexota bacterium]|nr:TlpA family protein disulfide reductase [Chloroflexota bacterium]